MAIITHAYHWPRVSRTFGAEEGFKWFSSGTKLIAYLVDRKFEAPGAAMELQLEMLKLPGYVEKGFILHSSDANTPYNGRLR